MQTKKTKSKLQINVKSSTTVKALDNSAVYSEGSVISLGDGIAWVAGLDEAMFGEVVNFAKGPKGMVLNLERERVGVLVLADYDQLQLGDRVITTGKILSIPVGKEILGRVIDPLGIPLDRKGGYSTDAEMPVEKIAPGIVERSTVNVPLQTGIKAIDAVIPIGRGQRELIIGDRGTGKTAIAIDTIISQKETDVICVYVAIGTKRAKLAQVIEKLKEHEVMGKTVIVAATASESSAMRYIAPYAGCAIGEYFMDQGKSVLVIYDDLTKHAWAYREISLLLKRPSGREAYPGDVFYLHSRLLERACQLSKANGGGSLTALPIIETQGGDVSAYIPTNVISITDGQIYLESDLFFSGIRPAVSVGLSVSRIGGTAQIKAIKKVAGKLRLDLSQYWELSTFAQFATDLDAATSAKIERGKRIVEVLKQPQYAPMPVEREVISVYLATSGTLDDIPLNLVSVFESGFLAFTEKKYSKVYTNIVETKELKEDTENLLKKAIEEYKVEFRKEFTLSSPT